MNIGEKIKLFRSEKQMTQLDLAKSSGVQVRTIQRYEAGNSRPKYNVLNQIANALNIPVQCFSSVDELIEQQQAYILSLPISQRLKVFRLCSGYSMESLASKLVSNLYVDCTNAQDDATFQKDVDAMLTELKFVESGYRKLNKSYISNLASVLQIPMELLANGPQADELSSKSIKYDLLMMQQNSTDVTKNEADISDELDDLILKLLLRTLATLNKKGLKKVADYARDLTKIKEYTDPENEE